MEKKEAGVVSVCPPSATMLAPVINLAASLRRKHTELDIFQKEEKLMVNEGLLFSYL